MTQALDIDVRSDEALRMAIGLAAASGRAVQGSFCAVSRGEVVAARALADVLGGTIELESGRLRFEPPPEAASAGERERDRDRPAIRVALPGEVPLIPLVLTATAALGARGAAREVSFEGSTHAPESASFEVASSCFVPLLERIGIRAELELDTAGFAPRGGGIIKASLPGSPSPPSAVELKTKEPLRSIGIFSGAPAAIAAHVHQRQAARARSGVALAGVPTHVQLVKLKSRKAGSVVAITGLFGDLPITVSAVSKRGGSVESVGAEAASEFRRAIAAGAVLPPLLVEPLILALAFAPGRSVLTTWRLPPEIERLAALARTFTEREVAVEGKPNHPGSVVIKLADRPSGTSY